MCMLISSEIINPPLFAESTVLGTLELTLAGVGAGTDAEAPDDEGF